MSESVIIDGCNVAECEYFLYRKKEEISERSCGVGLTNCKGKDCQFKQLQRLKAENEKLLKELQYKYVEMNAKGFLLMGEDLNFWKNLKAENIRLKAKNEKLKKELDNYKRID